jgi:hypothetical protein
MPNALEQFQWPYLVGTLLLTSTVLVAVWKIAEIVKAITAPLRQFVSEHDVLWEDYNIRTGGAYRRSTGRGAPPDPEEFYRHGRAVDVDEQG